MTLQEKSETYLNSLSASDGGDLLLDAWRICLAETLEKQQHAWERHVELMSARSAAIIGQLEAKLATLEARIQSRLGELKDGEPGPQGEQGRGERGSAGPVGLRGPRGEPGNRGERGEKGLAGGNGRDGVHGERGERGKVGPVGLRGPRGEKGERGEGVQGRRGDNGKQGEKGEKGETGQIGEQGPIGQQGEPGQAGERGPQGGQGPQGETGERGHLGQQGQQGVPGEPGPQGAQGDPGLLPMIRAWTEDEISYRGDVVSYDGATWQAQKDTAQTPRHRDWMLVAAAGRSAASPIVRGTFDLAQQYSALNIVAMNGSAFIARHDDPGECPGEGWQLIASAGRAGKPGPKGERGESGPRGLPAAAIVRGEVDRKTYTMKLILSDGSEIAVSCRGFFEQYHEERNG